MLTFFLLLITHLSLCIISSFFVFLLLFFFMFPPPQLLESDTSAPEKRSHSQRRVALQVLRQLRTLCGRSRCCAGRSSGLHQRWGENEHLCEYYCCVWSALIGRACCTVTVNHFPVCSLSEETSGRLDCHWNDPFSQGKFFELMDKWSITLSSSPRQLLKIDPKVIWTKGKRNLFKLFIGTELTS